MNNDHERIGPILASHERAWSLQAAEHEEGAERARDKKQREMGMHANAPEEARGRMEGVHDAEIARHESQARIYRRRAAHAAEGFLLASPDEVRDAEYQRHHSELIAMAQRTGRMRQSDESVG